VDSSLTSDTAGGISYIERDSTPIYPWSIDFPGGLPTGRKMSLDSRYIVITSSATNLLAGQIDRNNARDVFLFDRVTNNVTLVSHVPLLPAVAAAGDSFNPTISGDGRYVAYSSTAADLINNFTDNLTEQVAYTRRNIYLFDRMTSTTTLVSHDAGLPTKGSDSYCDGPLISDDGQFVAFQTKAKNLIDNGYYAFTLTHVYLFDRGSNSVSLVDHVPYSNTIAAGDSYLGSISGDGRYIAYLTYASGVIAGVSAPSIYDVVLYDQQTGTNALVSHAPGAALTAGNDSSFLPTMTRDGRYITFTSLANNLVSGMADLNGPTNSDVFVYDRIADQMTLVSRAEGFPLFTSNLSSNSPSISDDGRYLAFVSDSINLIDGFINNNGTQTDVYLFDRVTGSMTLASSCTTGPSPGSNGHNIRPIISGDGSIIVYSSRATDLVTGFVDQNNWISDGPGQPTLLNYDVFAFDRATMSISLISNQAGAANVGGNDRSHGAIISVDGKLIVYTTWANDQVSGLVDANGSSDVVLVDRVSNIKDIVSRRFGIASESAGGMSDLRVPINNSQWTSADFQHVSHDGRFVVFASLAENIVPGQVDTNHGSDIFVYDRLNNSTQLVSRAAGSATTTGDRPSGNPAISGDGRFVAYASLASNLVDGFVDGNGPGGNYDGTDVFLFDRQTGMTQLVSHKFGSPNWGANGTSATFTPYYTSLLSISADGRNVAYISFASDLFADFTDGNGGREDVILFDRISQTNMLVSRSAVDPNKSGNGRSNAPRLSDDGRFVAFSSLASNLASGSLGGGVLLFDRDTGTIQLVSRAWGTTTTGNGGSNEPRISGDGRWITYQSAASDLVPGGIDLNNSADVFLYDRLTGTNQLVSHSLSSPVNAGDYSSDAQVISADGRYVVFTSRARDLVPGFVDQNGVDFSGYYESDVFLYNRDTGLVTLVSRRAGTAATGGNDESWYPRISGDGRFVTYVSRAYDLVEGFVNAHASMSGYPTPDVYLYDRLTNTNQLVSHSNTNIVQSGDAASSEPTISRNGAVIVFSSQADDMVPADANGLVDIFAFVQQPPRVQSIEINDGSVQRSVIRSMTITFDDYVFLDTGHLSLVNGQGSGISCQESVQYQNNSTIVTLTFSGANAQFGSLADGNYEIKIISSQVSGVGNLDGNGDGVGGDDYVFTFHRLFGDANGDRRLDGNDFALFREMIGTSAMTFDFNNDGTTNASDFIEIRKRFGIALP